MSTGPTPPRPDAMHPLPAPPGPPAAPVRGLAARPKATWAWWEAILVYAGAFFIGGVAALPVLNLIGDDDLGSIVATVVAALVILGIIVFWLRHLHPRWVEVLGLPRRWFPDARAGAVFGLGLYVVVVFIVGAALVVLFQAVSGESVEAPEQVSTSLPPAGVVTTILYAVVLAPIGEELFFRGVLFRSIRDPHGFWAGGLASSIAFGSIHYIPGPALDSLLLMSVMVFTGLGLSYIYERRGSIVAPIAAHMMFNAIGLVLIYGIG
ncbi:MAG TPA: type II CAAX endopeptidase family protein [Actinomycetota bacterium]|nr:type II CAAX endopeptidase family protein [Actinomycetota bacterium]